MIAGEVNLHIANQFFPTPGKKQWCRPSLLLLGSPLTSQDEALLVSRAALVAVPDPSRVGVGGLLRRRLRLCPREPRALVSHPLDHPRYACSSL